MTYFRLLHDDVTGAVSYLLADRAAREAVLVDARGADVPVLRAMLDEHGLRLRWLLRTHEHDAAMPGEAAALDALQAPRVQHHGLEGGPLAFGGERLQVIPTPGHTASCLSFLWRDRLFCGDLLCVDGCAAQPRPALPMALWDSATRRVFTLPVETLLFAAHCRHGRAVSCVLEQRRWHPWFAGGASRDDFLARLRRPPAAPPVLHA